MKTVRFLLCTIIITSFVCNASDEQKIDDSERQAHIQQFGEHQRLYESFFAHAYALSHFEESPREQLPHATETFNEQLDTIAKHTNALLAQTKQDYDHNALFRTKVTASLESRVPYTGKKSCLFLLVRLERIAKEHEAFIAQLPDQEKREELQKILNADCAFITQAADGWQTKFNNLSLTLQNGTLTYRNNTLRTARLAQLESDQGKQAEH